MNRKNALLIFIGVLIDQITKLLAQKYLDFFNPLDIIPNALSFQLVHNYGAAYGILQNQRVFLLTISILVITLCVKYFTKIAPSKIAQIGLVFLLIGTIGNFIDRLYLGYVVDFIDIRLFPVFNIADMSIDIGICFFIGDIFLQKNDT